MTPRAAIAMLTGVAIFAPSVHAQVVLRGGEVLDGQVISVSLEGVAVAGDAGTTVIGWERVRSVQGQRAADAAVFAELSTDAWRAQARLARGDAALAEPVLESLWARNLPGPTGAAVAEGLLRCRISRGANLLAIRPWLDALRLGMPAHTPGSPIDADTGLCPTLPPLWAPGYARAALATDGALVLPDDAPAHARALATLYRLAAADDDIPDKPDLPADALKHPGVLFVRDIVLAVHGAAPVRLAARERLAADPERDLGQWREAWRRAAIGQSLLREDDPAKRRRGVLELLHVPARFSGALPELSALALALASDELARQNDAAGAASLRTELALASPASPALAWLDARTRRPPAGGAR